ncbi:MAG: response regulator transcription factor [Clostridia bacterium]|nr:response regulator transcription factor [Clostridia bacterium]
MKTVFILDDERAILDLISKYLTKEGYSVETFLNAEDLLKRIEIKMPDMFVLDIMLPGGMDGLELCRHLRTVTTTPIIFVSAKGEELDRILGLELGADGYLTKPFSPRELVAYIKTIFRRVDFSNEAPSLIEYGDLKLSVEERWASVNSKDLELTAKEFDLLSNLLGNINKAFSRQELLDRIWGYDYVGDIRVVDDLVKRLRRKLREAGAAVGISTVWGYGYKIGE